MEMHPNIVPVGWAKSKRLVYENNQLTVVGNDEK